jgi:uncharacterized protein (UPF0332 family)
MTQWLYSRLKEESPKIEPSFALQSSINWTKALGIICNNGHFEKEQLKAKYLSVPRRAPDTKGDNATFENILMAFHQYASLVSIHDYEDAHYDLIRSAIISWYYGIYYAASAMVAATDGSTHETHTSTANAWNRQLNSRDLILEPFNYRLTTLVKKDYEHEIEEMRDGNTYDLNQNPASFESAYGACLSYLKGTAIREREILENRMKQDREFGALGVSNFRSKVAREYRDRKLNGKSTAFLHQAFRFRGKANYRDAIYLSYGSDYSEGISDMISNLLVSLESFIKMSCHYSARRVERGTWQMFCDDIENYSQLGIDCDIIKVSKRL